MRTMKLIGQGVLIAIAAIVAIGVISEMPPPGTSYSWVQEHCTP